MRQASHALFLFWVICIFLVSASALNAAPVYKSTDEEGNVSYSSTPSNKAQKVEEVSVPKSSSEGAQDTDPEIERIKNKANELERERLAREKQIKEAKQKEQAKQVEEIEDEEPESNPRPIIQNRPLPTKPVPKPKPLPSRPK